jgi:hypothetical protein
MMFPEGSIRATFKQFGIQSLYVTGPDVDDELTYQETLLVADYHNSFVYPPASGFDVFFINEILDDFSMDVLIEDANLAAFQAEAALATGWQIIDKSGVKWSYVGPYTLNALPQGGVTVLQFEMKDGIGTELGVVYKDDVLTTYADLSGNFGTFEENDEAIYDTNNSLGFGKDTAVTQVIKGASYTSTVKTGVYRTYVTIPCSLAEAAAYMESNSPDASGQFAVKIPGIRGSRWNVVHKVVDNTTHFDAFIEPDKDTDEGQVVDNIDWALGYIRTQERIDLDHYTLRYTMIGERTHGGYQNTDGASEGDGTQAG